MHPLADSSLFQTLQPYSQIAVGVSGGSDSLALLLLLSDWARARGKILRAITVDHRLRAASRSEAAYVGALCERIGISHDILCWQGEKPRTGVADAARNARYELMTRHCAAHGIPALALGHTRDDQAETVLMRLQRTDRENRGLSGMAEKTLFSPDMHSKIMLHRPVLSFSRRQLRDVLTASAIDWVEDPTNDDARYERVRLRMRLAGASDLAQRLCDYARLHGRYRRHMAGVAAGFIDDHCCLTALDGVAIERTVLEAQAWPVAVLVLQILLSVVGGRDHLPSAQKVSDALRRAAPATLARVRIDYAQKHLILYRERRNLPPPVSFSRDPILWDNRFWLMSVRARERVFDIRCGQDIAPDAAQYFQNLNHDSVLKSAVFAKTAVASMPFWRAREEESLAQSAHFKPLSEGNSILFSRSLGAFSRYCADFDFPIRTALERLFTVNTLRG